MARCSGYSSPVYIRSALELPHIGFYYFLFQQMRVLCRQPSLAHHLRVQEHVEGPLLHEELLVVAVVKRREYSLEALAPLELQLCLFDDFFLVFWAYLLKELLHLVRSIEGALHLFFWLWCFLLLARPARRSLRHLLVSFLGSCSPIEVRALSVAATSARDRAVVHANGWPLELGSFSTSFAPIEWRDADQGEEI